MSLLCFTAKLLEKSCPYSLSPLLLSPSSHALFKTTSARLLPLLYNDTAFVRVTNDLHIAKFSGDLSVFLLIPAILWTTSSCLNIFSCLLRHLSLLVLLPHSAALLRPLYWFLHISFAYKCQKSAQQKPHTSSSLLTAWVALRGPITWNIHLYAGSLQIIKSSLKLSLEFQTPFYNFLLNIFMWKSIGVSNLTCLKPDNLHKNILLFFIFLISINDIYIWPATSLPPFFLTYLIHQQTLSTLPLKCIQDPITLYHLHQITGSKLPSPLT